MGVASFLFVTLEESFLYYLNEISVSYLDAQMVIL